MNLIGDLEFKTIINNKPVTITIPNVYVHNTNILIEGEYRKFVCEVTAIRDTKEEH